MANKINAIEYMQKNILFSKIKWMRLSLVVVAILVSSAHLFSSTAAETPEIMFWLELEVVVYIIIAIIYLLGLEIWYVPVILFSCLNIILFLASSFVIIPFISNSLLNNIDFATYTIGQALAIGGWIYLIAAGILLKRIDKGSKLNELLVTN